MSLTNLLLFLILVTLSTYLFTPWKNMEKPPTKIILLQFVIWLVFFSIVFFVLNKLNLII